MPEPKDDKKTALEGAERAEARGERIGFVQHLKVGVPVTMLTLAWGVMVVVTLAR